jgi:hypothetical protein
MWPQIGSGDWISSDICVVIIYEYMRVNAEVMTSILFGQKCGHAARVCMVESMQHILVNVSIRWEYRSAHTFHVQTFLYWQHLEIEIPEVNMWKQQVSRVEMHGSAMQSYVKHWVIVPFSIRQLKGRYMYSYKEECNLLACIAVDTQSPLILQWL